MVGSMLHSFGRRYVTCAQRLGLHDPNLIDAFYGDSGTMPMDTVRQHHPISAIIRDASALLRDIQTRGGDNPQRRHYLADQTQGLITRARIMDGEPIPLEVELRDCYGLALRETPEAELRALHHELASLLPPGDGTLAERFQRHVRERAIPANAALALLREVIAPELDRRTREMFPMLPAKAGATISLKSHVTWTAYNSYHGQFQSSVQFNADKPMEVPALPGIAAHELRPGHATHFALQELMFTREARAEHAIQVFGSSIFTVAEAWAMSALSIIMSRPEIVAWIEELLAQTGKSHLRAADELRITEIFDALRAAQGNMGIMLEQGVPRDVVRAYGQRWRLADDAGAKALLGFIDVFGKAYPFTYFAGQSLMEALLNRPEGRDYWGKRVLTEPVTPALIRAWIADGPSAIPPLVLAM